MIIAVTTKSRTQMKIPMKEKMKKEKETRRLFVIRSLPSRAAWLAEPLKRSAKKGRPRWERPQVTEETTPHTIEASQAR